MLGPMFEHKHSHGSLRQVLGCVVLALWMTGCNAGSATVVVPPFDSERAWRDLERIVGFGPRPAGSAAIEETRVYIESQLREAGLEPIREPFEAQTAIGAIDMCNVYADLEAPQVDGKPADLIVLCSHFDTWRKLPDFVGANDGGSSTAVLLELARALSATGPHPQSYRFLFVDGEEETLEWSALAGLDNTYGSRHHAQKLLRSPDYSRTKACVVIDLVGDRDLALWRDTNSDRRILGAFFEAARENGLGQYIGSTRQAVKDDHLAFIVTGIPSADLIDLDYGPDNSYWHTNEDTLDKCSRESLDAIGRIVLHGLPRLAQLKLR